MAHITDILSPVVPAEYRSKMDTEVIEFEYDRVNWDAVPNKKIVDNSEEIVAWGGYPGAYETVDADEFTAVKAFLDSTLSEANIVYVTDSGAYVYDFMLDEVAERTVRSEMLTVLSDLSRQGLIKGLRPTKEVQFPDLREHLTDFHDDITEFELVEQDEELVCRVVLTRTRSQSELLNEIQTVNGIKYPKPDRVEIVDSI